MDWMVMAVDGRAGRSVGCEVGTAAVLVLVLLWQQASEAGGREGGASAVEAGRSCSRHQGRHFLSHIALQFVCVCVCFRVSIDSVFMRVFRQAATADPQAPAGPFSGRQAERSKAERLAEDRQASERVNQQRMSGGAVRSRAPE